MHSISQKNARRLRMVEVGPRDGLQNESVVIPTDVKVAFVDALSQAGLDEIEVSAFVSPKWIPQLADAHDVFTRIRREPGVIYSALVPNELGLKRAIDARVDKIAVFTAASETFTRKNVNTTIDGTFERFAPVMAEAKTLGIPVRGYVSTAFWCPYEGHIAPEKTVAVVERLLAMGCHDISIGDTIGKAVPSEVRELTALLLTNVPASRLAMHFHDTYGRALANVVAAWELGIDTFDASVAGLGGCPYAPGAPGNVSTESVVRTLEEHGALTTVNLTAIGHARAIIEAVLK